MRGVLAAGCAVLAVVLLLAGCGGGESTTSLTRAEFIKQANAICKKSSDVRAEQFAGEASHYKPGEKVGQDVKENLVVSILVGPYREMTAELEDLGIPRGDEQEVEKIYKAMEKAAREAESNPLVAFKSVEQFEEANELAIEYGLTSCRI